MAGLKIPPEISFPIYTNPIKSIEVPSAFRRSEPSLAWVLDLVCRMNETKMKEVKASIKTISFVTVFVSHISEVSKSSAGHSMSILGYTPSYSGFCSFLICMASTTIRIPSNAPSSWNSITYKASFISLPTYPALPVLILLKNSRFTRTPVVTAGLKWPPDTGPKIMVAANTLSDLLKASSLGGESKLSTWPQLRDIIIRAVPSASKV